MLNRLMFCYFMQKRGFLNRDRDYLRHNLEKAQQNPEEGNFYSFYRSFLKVLFHEGLDSVMQTEEIKAKLGDIPYLDGGLFEIHELERKYPDLDISDDAFRRIFSFFDQYEWHLDTRNCATGNEINPDVLGYIFEKYINDRAAMGAYYTQEDITNYISRSTILPYLLEATKKAYPKAFEPRGQVWSFLQQSGDEFIFESVRKGAGNQYPDYIEIGLDTTQPDLLQRRARWNEVASEEFALPTEIWREVVERLSRYEQVRSKIDHGEITDVADLITYNLDIEGFVSSLLDSIDDSVFIRAFYAILEKITVLDPTCGSGAFLFAALSILEPLYDICLSRMKDYLDNEHRGSLGKTASDSFKGWLQLMDNDIHPSKVYFIYKSIILNNLYGVDIMREAVETAKLRLFLKLVSTVDPDYRKPNIGIEPLPDIDFNIRAGNSLIGYTSIEDIQAALGERLEGVKHAAEIESAMHRLSKATDRFKELQLGGADSRAGGFKEAKNELVIRQKQLKFELDCFLRDRDYPSVSDEAWEKHHMPFHWVADFYQIIIDNNGFNVVIGNPPYVEYSKVQRFYSIGEYKTRMCGNLYAYVLERCEKLRSRESLLGMIVPLSICSGQRMLSLRNLVSSFFGEVHISSYEIFPSKLFDDAFQRMSIIISNTASGKTFRHSTRLHRWYSVERSELISRLIYTSKLSHDMFSLYGNYRNDLHYKIINMLMPCPQKIANYCRKGNEAKKLIYYQESFNYWLKASTTIPHYKKNGVIENPAHGRILYFDEGDTNAVILAAMYSSLFYLWYITFSDGFHLSDNITKSFPITQRLTFGNDLGELIELSRELESDIRSNSSVRTRNTKRDKIEIETYKVSLSKNIIDRIDTLLASYYGLADEQLDFIINYDIKYRQGLSIRGGSASEEE